MSGVRVEVLRGGRVESVHVVDVAVVDAEGRRVVWSGEPDRRVFARSAIKPFQAMPLVEEGVLEQYALGDDALALSCGSHSGEPRHVEVARKILRSVGAAEDDLACGPHAPFDGDAAHALVAAGDRPGRLHNNCSGKHAGMLALAAAHGWERAGYHEERHPVQQRMRAEVERWSGVDEAELETGVDGCGVVAFRFPLAGLALAYARLIEEAERPGTSAAQVVEAMTRDPFLVAGTDRLCTRLMEVTEGRVVAKVGAEGVYAAAIRGQGLGIALKARDGARRAAEVALLGVLESLSGPDWTQAAGAVAAAAAEPRTGPVGPAELELLARWAQPELRNTRGEVVGTVRSRVELERSHG